MTQLIRELRPGDPVALGPWRLLGVLGEGGMGSVYLGRSGRRVAAVKTLRTQFLDDPHFLARFRRERQAAGAVRSPYVPRVLGADLTASGGQVPWIATEFAAGPTLERCVDERGPLPADSVRALGGLLAAALAALHQAGVVHRDLKPSNVLLTVAGPRLVDFGIARMPAATAVTVTGQRPGSAGYMSPEQVLGRELGPPSDVFTLASVLVYASTGHHAFGGDGGPALADYGIVHEEPDLSPLPGVFAGELRPCLAKDPGIRPTAGELAALWEVRGSHRANAWLPEDVLRDVREWGRHAGELTGAWPSGPWSRRRVLGAAGGAALLAGLGGAGWRWLDGSGGGDGPGGEVPLWDGAPGERPEPLWSADGLAPGMPFGPARAGEVLLVADRGRVVALDPRTGDRLWRHEGARAPAPVAPWPALIGRDGVLRGFDSRTGEVSWRGPDGLARLLAVAEGEGGGTVYAADSGGHVVAVRRGAERPLWRSEEPLAEEGGAVAVAGGGRLLVTAEDGTLHALDSGSGERSWTVKGVPRGSRAALGGGFAVVGGTKLRGLGLDRGTERWRARPNGDAGQFGAPVVHAGLVYAADGGVIRSLRLDGGADVREISGPDGTYAVTQPVVATHGLYVPLTNGADGVAALPLTGDSERYRFAPVTQGDEAWAVVAAGGVVAVQNGGRLYALPRF
ncbi:PQQ-binding-like beta-propeller repeat protein [Streptomyces sp. NPDC059009]|uniref:serine/threonine-protein kinase n=1 Tax=Streptomyces sp. NPDC059009 TaxID=3346694 RepID=UPI0036A7F226